MDDGMLKKAHLRDSAAVITVFHHAETSPPDCWRDGRPWLVWFLHPAALPPHTPVSAADGTAAVINDFFFHFPLFTRGSVALLQLRRGHGEPIGRLLRMYA